jgi:hypothetical protein
MGYLQQLMRRGLRVEPGKVKLVQTRKEVQRKWRVIRQLLMRQGERDLAEEVGGLSTPCSLR